MDVCFMSGKAGFRVAEPSPRFLVKKACEVIEDC